jgi:ribosomal protein S15P/S13E
LRAGRGSPKRKNERTLSKKEGRTKKIVEYYPSNNFEIIIK